MKLFTVILLLIFSHVTLANDTNLISFGIVPQQSNEKIQRLWNPIIEHINQQTGLQLQFKPAKDIPTFEKMLNQGEFDIAYMNPYHYVTAHKSQGYQAINKSQYKTIKGILVTQKNKRKSKVSDLDGATIAFPSPNAFAATMLIKNHLTESNIKYKAEYVTTHDAVYRAVAEGKYPAGGGVVRTLKNTDPEIRKQLRIAWRTKGYTPHAIAKHPRINQTDAEKIQGALLTLTDNEEGKQIIKKLNMKSFTKANDNDWQDARDLVNNLKGK